MFGCYDKMTLSLVNAADTDGKLIPFSLTLPVGDEIIIPSQVASVDLFEYQEGFIAGGEIVFSIFVGEKSTIDEMIDKNDGIGMHLKDEIEIPSVKTPVCYQVVNNKKKIYAVLEENDVVVKDHDELRKVISRLSSDYSEFSRTAEKIKQFSKNNNQQ